MRVLAAMSGGVDSAVAAARAVKAGHDVVGVHLALSQDPQAVRESSRGCCSLEDSADARRVCDKLGIPFYVWDFSDRFKTDVIDDFVDSYARGETPNPCLRCNEKIKFAALLERGIALGFDAVVTGHYARLTQPADGGDGYLRRGVDPNKDQSYVLGVLGHHEIAHCMFPVGDTIKPKIREEAAAMGFSVAKKPDSYDICFIPDGNTQAFLGERIGLRPGMIVDTEGNTLREHDGAWNYTIGQRKGLGFGGGPWYVVRKDIKRNIIYVSRGFETKAAYGKSFRIEMPYFITYNPYEADGDYRVTFKVRHTPEFTPGRLLVRGGKYELHSDELIQGIAPGQFAVLYDEQAHRCLGSGEIGLLPPAKIQ